MSETDDFAHVQRRLCAVIAKSEWTSSRMRMQKSGDELRERRAKTHRTANQFLQDLYEKRTDADLIDDHGALDRYQKFSKSKTFWNDENNATLDDFERRLRGLNQQRYETSKKLNQTYTESTFEHSHTPTDIHQGSIYDLLSNSITQPQPEQINEEKESNERILFQAKPSRILPSINAIPITSTPNDTVDDLLDPQFNDDDDDHDEDDDENHKEKDQDQTTALSLHELSQVQSVEPISRKTQRSTSSFEQLSSSPLEQLVNRQSITPTLCKPQARRLDGTEFVPVSTSSSSSLPQISTKVLPWSHCSFPRSLTSRNKAKNSTNVGSKRQLPSVPMGQGTETKSVSDEPFDETQLYQLLDQLDSQITEDFTQMLDQLTVSSASTHRKIDRDMPMENLSSIDEEKIIGSEEMTLPDFFDYPLRSAQEKSFYSTFTISLTDLSELSLYTMTFSTVQLSSSIVLPYSILNGRRPALRFSKATPFKPVRSKRTNYLCRATAIESAANINALKPNDIILKINDQSVWRLTTEAINELFKQYRRRSNSCSVVIARLCQPFV